MNKNTSDRDKLLAGAFHDEWSEGHGAEFARDAAALVRRRRTHRRAAVACAIAAMGALALIPLHHPPLPDRATPAAGKTSPAYEIISDDELLALLHDRPLLVMPKKNGTREFVLVDK